MKNLVTIERALRVALGGALTIWASVLLRVGDLLIWRLVFVAPIALGLDFIVTGIHGCCPPYNLLGWSAARPEVHG